MARYTPLYGDSTGAANFDLYPIMYQQTVPWPYSADDPNGSAATVAAIAYIAGVIGIGPDHCDIRSGYLNSSDQDKWAGWAYAIPTSAPTSWPTGSSCASYFGATTPPANYADIVSQLQNEFNSVGSVYGLIGNLKAPFIQNETNTIISVQNIATQIYATVKPQPPSSTGVSFGWLDIFDGVMDVLSAIPDLPGAAIFGLLGAGGDLAGALVENYSGSTASGGPGSPAYKIHVEAVNLSTQLLNQTTQHLDALDNLNIILLSDAGKLVAVGSQVNGNKDWEWTDAVTKAAVTFLSATTVQSSYSALLPPTWLQWNLKPNFMNQSSSADQTTWECNMPDATFGTVYKNAITYNPSTSPPTYGNMFYSRVQMTAAGSSETSTTEAWAFSQHATSSEAPGPKPTVSLTNDIFGSGVDSAINLVQGAAYPPAWYRSTFNPPGAFTCTANSIGDAVLWVRPTEASPPPIPATTIGPQEANETQGYYRPSPDLRLSPALDLAGYSARQ